VCASTNPHMAWVDPAAETSMLDVAGINPVERREFETFSETGPEMFALLGGRRSEVVRDRVLPGLQS
jgi:hypothetical protein